MEKAEVKNVADPYKEENISSCAVLARFVIDPRLIPNYPRTVSVEMTKTEPTESLEITTNTEAESFPEVFKCLWDANSEFTPPEEENMLCWEKHESPLCLDDPAAEVPKVSSRPRSSRSCPLLLLKHKKLGSAPRSYWMVSYTSPKLDQSLLECLCLKRLRQWREKDVKRRKKEIYVLTEHQHKKTHLKKSKESFFPLSTIPEYFYRSRTARVIPKQRNTVFGSLTDDSGLNPEEESKDSAEGHVASIDIKLPRRSLLVEFSCNSCGERTKRLINRLAYERGLVFVQCAGCLRHHKLVDNLGLIVEYDFRQTSEDLGTHQV